MQIFQERQFTQAYHRLMLWTFCVVLAVAGGLIGLLVHGQSRAADAELAEQFRTRAQAIDNWLEGMAEQLRLLEAQAAADLRARALAPDGGPDLLFEALAPAGPTHYALDRIPPPYRREEVGNLSGIGDLGTLPVATRDELKMALGLHAMFPAVRRNTAHATWVYYTSARGFIHIHPWVPSSQSRFEPALLDKPFFQLGLPALNPERGTRWTPPYLDDYGAGLMVTATRPVDGPQGFAGTVSVDITLQAFAAQVRGFHGGTGALMIVDDAGRVLADPAADAAQARHVPQLRERLDPALHPHLAALLQGEATGPRRTADHLHLSTRLRHAPWTLLYVAPEPPPLLALLTRAGLLLLVLLAALTAMLLAMRRVTFAQFIAPAEALVRHIFLEGDGRPAPVPAVPSAWQAWFGTVSRAFAHNRQLLDEIGQKNQQLAELNLSLGRHAPRLLLVLSLQPRSGATTTALWLADALARQTPDKRTVLMAFPAPRQLAARLGLDADARVHPHPNGFDIWTHEGAGQVPPEGLTSLLLAQLLHRYDNLVIHARWPSLASEETAAPGVAAHGAGARTGTGVGTGAGSGTASGAAAATAGSPRTPPLEPLLQHARAVVLLVPPQEAGSPRVRAALRRVRTGLGQHRAPVVVLGQAQPPQAADARGHDAADVTPQATPGAPRVAQVDAPGIAATDLDLPWLPDACPPAMAAFDCPAPVARVLAELISRVDRVHQISAYIPTTQAVDQPLDTSEVVQRTLAFFSLRFGGATVSPARGAWHSDQAGVVSEQVWLVISHTTQEDLSQHVDDVVDYVRRLKRELSQEAMAIEINHRLMLV